MEFTASVETAGELARRIRVLVPPEAIDGAVTARLRELGRTLSLKGFRPGKTPERVIRQRYGTEVRLQVIQEQLQQICRTTISQQGLDPAGPADIRQEPTEPGAELVFVATMEIYPTFVIADPAALEIEVPVVEISEQDADELLQRLRRQARSWEIVHRPARAGDRLTVDFRGGVAGATAVEHQGIAIVLGEGEISSQAEAQLTGLSAGMSVTIETGRSALVPADAVPAGPVRFEVTVREVAEALLPDIDAAFCRRLGIGSGDPADLRSAAVADMEREAGIHVREIVKARLARRLRERVPLTLPGVLRDREVQKLATQAGKAGMAAPQGAVVDDALRAAAERNVHWALVIRQVFRQEKMRVTREEINRKIATTGAPGENQEQRQNWFYEHPELLDELEYAVMEDKVVDWLLQSAQVTGKPMNFVDLIATRKRPDPAQSALYPF